MAHGLMLHYQHAIVTEDSATIIRDALGAIMEIHAGAGGTV